MSLISLVKKGYRRYFYQTLKKAERIFRQSLFWGIERVYPNFNAYRVFGVPRGVSTVESEEVMPPTDSNRTRPLTLETWIPPRFQAVTGGAPAERLARVPGGIVTATAAALNARGELIPQFTQQFTMKGVNNHKLFTFRGNRFMARISHFEGSVASLAIDCHTNYYHWLFDALGKVAILEKAGLTPDYYYVDTSREFQRDSLAMLGIPAEKLIPMQTHPVISAHEMILTTFPCIHDPGVWMRDYLRTHFPCKQGKGGRRLFISRKEAPCRQIVNEDCLVSLLEKEGFESVEPGRLMFREQIDLFSEASYIVAPHGAGLANLVFCPPETRVLEIIPPRYLAAHYWILSNVLGFRYAHMISEDQPQLHCPEPAQDALYVDPVKLKQTLKLLA